MKKKLFSSICICAITLSAMGAIPVVFADGFTEQIESKNQEINGLIDQQAGVQSQISTLENQISSINNQANVLLNEQDILRQELEVLQEEITDLEVRIAKRDDAIQLQARETQVNGKSDNYISAVLEADSLSTVIQRMQAMTTMVRANKELLVQQKEDKQAVEDKQASAAAKMSQLQNKQAELENQKGELDAKQADLNVLKAALAVQQANSESQREDLILQQQAYEEEQARIAEEARVAEEVRQRAQAEAAAASQAAAETLTAETSLTSNTQEGEASTGQNQEEVLTPEIITVNPENNENNNVVTPTPPSTPVATPPVAPSNVGAAIVAEAQRHIGKPYVWGAKGPDSFDCSGFTRYVYLQVTGRDIGGWTVPQEGAGTVIPVSQAQAGDLLFWGSAGNTHHVGISLGGSSYIHAPRPGQTVRVDNTQFYMPSFAVRVN